MATGSGRAPKTRPSLSLQRKIHCHPAIHCDCWGQDFLTNRWVSRFEPSQPFVFIYVSHTPPSHLFFQETKAMLATHDFFWLLLLFIHFIPSDLWGKMVYLPTCNRDWFGRYSIRSIQINHSRRKIYHLKHGHLKDGCNGSQMT